MTITHLAITLGLLLILFGVFCFIKRNASTEAVLQGLLRHPRWEQLVFIIASLWFLGKICALGEADFGQYRHWLLLLFIFAFSGCCIYWKDFLIVRGAAMLALMGIQKGLAVGYMSTAYVRPYVSLFLYICILLALFFGIYPYRVRDILPVLFKNHGRYLRVLGGTCLGFGTLLIFLSFK